jgi:type I restriction enzyme S subunit
MLDTFFEYAMSGAKGSKMPRGDAKMLTKYPICYPPITEQLAIINILTDADKEIELAKEKLANLQSQKRGLMQQLLTGKKRIK